jgi:hypothetical protein
MVFGYCGTASYSSFNNINYIRFLLTVDAIPQSEVTTLTHWQLGLLDHPLLSTFACEKYVVANGPVEFQMEDRYEFLRRYNNVYVFRNRLFLPLWNEKLSGQSQHSKPRRQCVIFEQERHKSF